MKLTYSIRMLILISILFAVVLLADVVFTQLLLGKIFDINDKVKQLNLSNQEREREMNLKDSIINSQTDRERLSDYLVGSSNADLVAFTKSLEELALKEGVTQRKSLDYEPVASLNNSEFVSAIRYRFNITGSWSKVFNFLQAIENLPRIVRLNNVSLASSGEDKNLFWSADLDFSVVRSK